VIDLDIKNFFDEIDHEKLLKALNKHVEEKWVLRYIERWLKAPLQNHRGEVIARTKGTPQGGVISPLLTNLFLHYTLDVWLGRVDSIVEFVVDYNPKGIPFRSIGAVQLKHNHCHLLAKFQRDILVDSDCVPLCYASCLDDITVCYISFRFSPKINASK
jgi:retron-type reverse transcriptase